MPNSTDQAPDMSRCVDCIYYFGAADPGCYRSTLHSCIYILRAKRRRPCPPGAACTVYKRMPNNSLIYRDRLNRDYRAFRLEKYDGGQKQ